jgi:enediyne biosynthesis protein E4
MRHRDLTIRLSVDQRRPAGGALAWFGCLLAAVAVLSLMMGCRRPEAVRPGTAEGSGDERTERELPQSLLRWRDITGESGVEITYRNGRESQVYSIVESLGGGTGACDYDRDGRADLFFTGGGQFEGHALSGLPSRLFRNLTGERFEEVAAVARVAEPHTYTQGCCIGDYDGDGFGDVLVTGYAGLQLLRNCGDGTFEEVARQAGLTDPLWSSSAAYGDFNGDGATDLYVTHYVDWSFENDPVCPSPWPEHDRDVCPPRAFKGLPDTLYYSQGDGTFRDVSAEAGLRDDGKGLGVITADFDHDGDIDIYVANDMVDNFLYQNDGTGHFEEVALLTGTATDFEGKPNGSMGLAVCDYDNNLAPDLWVTNFEQETFALYRNDGAGNFVHVSREAGITALGNLFVGFGTAMGDFDLDGDEDTLISNGHVVYYPTIGTLRQSPVVLENIGNGRFVRLPAETGSYFAQEHLGRGLIVADLNNDGLQDAVFGHSNEPSRVLLNVSQTEGEALAFELVGRRSSRNAVGARVVLETTAGKQLRHLPGGGSFQSQSELRVHFGLPPGSQLQKATIWWPSGTVQTLTQFDPSGTVVIVEEAAAL